MAEAGSERGGIAHHCTLLAKQVNMPERIFKAHILNPKSEEQVDYYNPGYLVLNEKGKILELTDSDPGQRYPNAHVSDLSNRVIIPGLIDVHMHIPQFAFLGKGGGIPLLEWLETLTFPTEAKFSDDEYAAKIITAFFDELVANGTTTASMYSSIHESATDIAFETAAQKGLRGFIGKTMMDQNSPEALTEDTQASVDASIRLFEKWNGHDNGRLQYIFTPRFAPTCTQELMKAVGKFAQENNAYLQTHLDENDGEIKWVAELFPEGTSYMNVYEQMGIAGERVIMGHCIHLTDDEVRIMQATGTRIAHCPHSNRNLNSGLMPYFKWKDAGLKVALATDIAAGLSISMIGEMEQAIRTSKELNYQGRALDSIEAFHLATLAGAKIMSIDDVTGNLDPGKEADFLVLQPEKFMQATPSNAKQILDALTAPAGKECVEEVYVRGKRIN